MSEAVVFPGPTGPINPETQPRDVSVMEFYPDDNKVRILDVVATVLPLPDDPLAGRFIPSWESKKQATCMDTPTALLIRDLIVRMEGGIPSRSEGPTGVSKSFAIELLAGITNRSFLRHNYSKDSDPGDTIGRFVPSDQKTSVRFEELLADNNLTKASRALIEDAQKANRPLTRYESMRVAANEGMADLEDARQWRWQNGTLTGSMMYGSTFGADEPNLAPGNVLERENPALEKRPQLRLVEHEGEIIRGLTAEEQSIIDDGGIVPGVIGLNQQYWYVAAQNPWGIGGGRSEESEARRNRLQDRIVEALTAKEYEEYLTFLIKGDQPNVQCGNHVYAGEKNVQTAHRDLEAIPNVDVIIPWLAGFQVDLQKLVESGRIGSEKDINGGSYVYSRRNMERFLDTLKGAQKSLVDTNVLFDTNKIALNKNWHDLFMEALRQEYLAGLYKEDAGIIEELIAASGIEEKLGTSVNNPTVPGWVERARKNGVQVDQRGGEWVLQRTSLTNALGELARLGDAAHNTVKYRIAKRGEDVAVEPQLRGILDILVHMESEPEQEAVTATDNLAGGMLDD